MKYNRLTSGDMLSNDGSVEGVTEGNQISFKKWEC